MSFEIVDIYDKAIFDYEWGLVLEGGGGKGAYQIGAMKALRECQLANQIIAIAGTSIGALNMCTFVQKNPKLGEIIWKSITKDEIFDHDVTEIDFREGFFSRVGLEKIMDDYINFEQIANSTCSLFATVTKLDENGNIYKKAIYMKLNDLEKKKIKQILLATSALPVIYESVKINGEKYRDGGLVDNLPIRPLYHEGIRHFIVVSLSNKSALPYSHYSDCEFIHIRPSEDLGNLLSGTLNFDKSDITKRIKLGYLDSAKTIKYYKSPEEKSKDFALRLEYEYEKENES